MTGRIAAMSIDGTPVSETDMDRIVAEERLHDEWRRRTVRVVAAAAHDAADCRMLLSILGLEADVVQAARAEKKPQRGPGKRRARAVA